MFPLIAGEKSIGGSPIGGHAEILMMLDFCNRHAIEPIIEEFPLSRVNEYEYILNQEKHTIE